MHATYVGVIMTFLYFLCHSLLNEFKLTFSFSLGFPSFVSVKPGTYCQVEDEQ